MKECQAKDQIEPSDGLILIVLDCCLTLYLSIWFESLNLNFRKIVFFLLNTCAVILPFIGIETLEVHQGISGLF